MLDTKKNKGFAGLQSLVSDVDLDVVGTEDSRIHEKSEADSSHADVAAGNSPEVSKTNGDSDTRATVASGPVASGNSNWPWLAVVVGSVVIGGIWLANLPPASGPSIPAQLSSAPMVPALPAVKKESVAAFVVAAPNANLRAQPQGRAKIVGTLPRGALIQVLEQRDGFVKCKPDGRAEGWVAVSVLVNQSDAARLNRLSADSYVESRRQFAPIDKLIAHVESLSSILTVLRFQVANFSDTLPKTIRQIESYPKPVIESDPAGGIWFSLEARALLDQGKSLESFKAARAAVFADALNADYHTALGYAAIGLEDKSAIFAAATVLPALAPGATNSWVIAGFSAALEDLGPLSVGAFRVAIDRSKNKATTVKVLKDLSARTKDVRVFASIAEALNSEQSPPAEAVDSKR